MHVDCSSSETFDYSLCSLPNCNLSYILYYTQFCFINAPCLSSSLFFVAQSCWRCHGITSLEFAEKSTSYHRTGKIKNFGLLIFENF